MKQIHSLCVIVSEVSQVKDKLSKPLSVQQTVKNEFGEISFLSPIKGQNCDFEPNTARINSEDRST